MQPGNSNTSSIRAATNRRASESATSVNAIEEAIDEGSGLSAFLDSIRDLAKFAFDVNGSTTELQFERYQICKSVLESSTSIPENSLDSHKEEKLRMIAIIQSCYFEAGIWSEADAFFETLKQRNYGFDMPLKVLSDITNHNLSDQHILEGVLHILSNYDYEDVNPYGITIAIACAVNHSPIIQDLLISCFEKWNSVDAIDILESLSLNDDWLIEYRDDVVNQLRLKKGIA